VIEVGTGVCRDMAEAREDIVNLRRQMLTLAGQNGLLLVAGATHPFADWRVQDISPDERYLQVVEDMQLVARANLIFGLHVHVGIEDRETAIHLMNQVRYFLPHLLALSTNSPFWLGMNTGLKSYRCKVFDKFPRTNIPDHFNSWADYESFVNLLIRTNCIDNAKKIWWDVRPHPFFPTIEVRICDLPLRVDETLAIAALIQATVYKLWQLHSRNQAWRPYSRALIMENKWRAARYGIDGALIDFGREVELPERELLEEYLEFVDPVLDELGSRRDVEHVRWIMEHGSGADRQLAEFARTSDLSEVVEFMVRETQAGL
jgi:carboxylate-amine ligase